MQLKLPRFVAQIVGLAVNMLVNYYVSQLRNTNNQVQDNVTIHYTDTNTSSKI